MKKLLDISDLTKEEIYQIWNDVAQKPNKKISGNIAWSFEGNGIRTRSTFLQAFQGLGLAYVELPNFLKTNESIQDLSGYMDSLFSMYVIRDNNHQRMTEFAEASTKPFINAMSSEAHPCEVLTDAYYLESKYTSLQELRILLWGPVTNVFQSWHSLSKVLNLNLTHFCPLNNHKKAPDVSFVKEVNDKYDVVITDAWPSGFSDDKYSLSESKLIEIGSPLLLPTPPVAIGNELLFSPQNYVNFSGYTQKALLLPIQKAIICHMFRS